MPWRSKENGDVLLALLARACEADQGATLLGGSWLLSRQDDFPDPWEPSIPGLGLLLHRLLHDAGLDEYQVEIVDVREPLAVREPLEIPIIEFVALERGAAVFQVGRFGIEEAVFAGSCLEVAKARVVANRTSTPFRDAPLEAELGEGDEKLATVMAIVLGFGIWTTNAASSHHVFAEGQIGVHGSTTTHRAQLKMGALPAADVCFLLAVALILRQESDTKAITRALHAEQAKELSRWLEELSGSREALLAELQLPDEPIAKLARPAVPRISEERAAGFAEQEKAFLKPNQEVTVALRRKSRVAAALLGSSSLGLIAAIPFSSLLGTIGITAVLAGFAFVGGLVGKRHPVLYCGACDQLVKGGSPVCSRCAARLDYSEQAHQKLLLADNRRREGEDEDEDELLAQEALAAGQPPSPEDDGRS